MLKEKPRPSIREQQQRRATLRPHPARDQIIDVMRSYGQPISPTRLARVTGASLGSVAYHMRTLVSAGVIVLADEGRVRGAVEHFYALANKDEAPLTDPAETLLALCGALTLPSPNGGYPRRVVLDDKARGALDTLLARLRPQVQTIVAGAAKRATDKR
ncbi:MAG TPA: winged helix-turn-helix transcriptional regulator [Baekduia sp.]|jgi:DNA-binding transcriptional ArsR family regulator|nr:winged helix-turn-helix transcriptional regulator [Baekduia sp.]